MLGHYLCRTGLKKRHKKTFQAHAKCQILTKWVFSLVERVSFFIKIEKTGAFWRAWRCWLRPKRLRRGNLYGTTR